MDDEILRRAIERHPNGSTLTTVLAGNWDSVTDGTLVRDLKPLLEEGYRDVILDATDVTFCDSVCLGALVSLHKMVSEYGGRLRVVAPSGAVRRPLEMAGLDALLDLYDIRPPAEPIDHAAGEPTGGPGRP